ncbi:MAG: hypothetical protein IMF05_01750 [Proteobacteria bacterium]|nr:hypothetical protein [Pseudomonadota bacterium]
MKLRLAITGLLATAVLLGGVVVMLVPRDTGDSQPTRVVEQSRQRVVRCRVLDVRETTVNDPSDGETVGRPGIEYFIILADGSEPVVIQDFKQGDRILTTGETCRLLIQENGERRVMPAEKL